jgi:hypothetical protein
MRGILFFYIISIFAPLYIYILILILILILIFLASGRANHGGHYPMVSRHFQDLGFLYDSIHA